MKKFAAQFNYTQRRAWMAGFVDGEGCLTISKQIRKMRPTPSWRCSVTIANTNKLSLQFFKENYGGTLRENIEKRFSRTGVRWSDSYTWYCPVSSVRTLLHDIKPFLIIKKKQADILIEFLDHIHVTKRSKGGREPNGKFKGSEPFSKSIIREREKLRNKIQSLNSGKRFR